MNGLDGNDFEYGNILDFTHGTIHVNNIMFPVITEATLRSSGRTFSACLDKRSKKIVLTGLGNVMIRRNPTASALLRNHKKKSEKSVAKERARTRVDLAKKLPAGMIPEERVKTIHMEDLTGLAKEDSAWRLLHRLPKYGNRPTDASEELPGCFACNICGVVLAEKDSNNPNWLRRELLDCIKADEARAIETNPAKDKTGKSMAGEPLSGKNQSGT